MELTRKFIEDRLKQATSDVMMYQAMLAELIEAAKKNRVQETEAGFLRLLTTQPGTPKVRK